MNHRQSKLARTARSKPVPGAWGVWVAPGLYVSSPNTERNPPSRFHRFMMRALLGWRWEQVEPGKQPGGTS